MGRLSGHPHIVTIYDVGEEDGQPYIVSEYMAGGDVEALIAAAENHQLDLERALAIADHVAQALEHAHADGVVHRDVKPGNIWLAEDGTAKLGDFGLAFAASDSRMTTEGTMLGTVAYMPPEQALGNAATPQSDLYSLGCALYEMVVGRPPFVGDDAVTVISQHLNTAPVAPSWNRADCPSALEELIETLLAKAPEDRPDAATTVRAELARIDLSTADAAAAHANPLARLARGVFVGRDEEMQRLRRARRAIQEEIARIGQRASADKQNQIIEHELQTIVGLREKQLQSAMTMFESDLASEHDVNQAREELALAQVQLAQQRREAARSVGGDLLASLNGELSTLSIDAVEMEAHARMLKQQAAEFQAAHLLELADEYDGLMTITLPSLMSALERAMQRHDELNHRVQTSQLPSISIIGGD